MFTKATIVEFNFGDQSPIPLYQQLNIKGEEMKDQGKTDNAHTEIASNTFRRVWLDQTAAEEWLAAVYAKAADLSITVVSTQIIDNV